MSPQRRRFHHLCLDVADIEESARELARTLGAGPFFMTPHARFDEILDGAGRPCSWDHSVAFGLLGGQLVELNETHALAPPPLADSMGAAVVSHIGFLVEDLEAECARLEELGATRVMTARTGPVRFAYHQTPSAGRIETFQADPFFDTQLAAITAATEGWGGVGPVVRPMSALFE